MMKTFDEAFRGRMDNNRRVLISQDDYRKIQRDALDHAASLCKYKKLSDPSDYETGHANRGVGDCRDAILLESKKLT